MKLTLHKKTKKYILLAIIVLLVFTGIQEYRIFSSEEVIRKENIVFNYKCQPSLEYKVFVKESEIYPKTILEEGDYTYYSKLLLDKIEAEFNVEYNSSKPTPMNIEYQVFATVNGYQGQAPGKVIYWSKSFPLTNNRVIETEGDSWSGKEAVPFTLKDYDAFAVKAKEISGMKVSNELIVELKGSISAKASKEDVVIPISASMTIPLLEDVFKIEKIAGEPIDVSVTETEEAIIPPDPSLIILLGFLMAVLIGLMPILWFKIREPGELDMLRKKNNVLLKNYGSRMVAMEEIPDLNCSRYYQVHSIKDMIKIADEIQKPIIYVPDDMTLLRGNELYIIDQSNLYRWNSA
ncbi:hypothetical protein MASR2M70_02380 [Bacillota bacterium]